MKRHRIIVEETPHGPRCAQCKVALIRDKVGYYHAPSMVKPGWSR